MTDQSEKPSVDAIELPEDPISTLRRSPSGKMYAVRMLSFDTAIHDPEPVWYVFPIEGYAPPNAEADFSVIKDWEVVYDRREIDGIP